LRIAEFNLATDPSSLYRATQDRPVFALSSYAGQAHTDPASLSAMPRQAHTNF